MGTVLASAIIGKAWGIIQDTTGVRWPSAEMLGWLNEGQKEIAKLKPTASIANESVQLVGGSKQTIPSTAIALLNVPRNMGADGTTMGDSILPIMMSVLDEIIPGWHKVTANAAVRYFTVDPRNPRNFYVYPPQPVTPSYVEEVYSVIPEEIEATTNPITIEDTYEGCLVDYLLYRAYQKDSQYAGNGERSAVSYGQFLKGVE